MLSVEKPYGTVTSTPDVEIIPSHIQTRATVGVAPNIWETPHLIVVWDLYICSTQQPTLRNIPSFFHCYLFFFANLQIYQFATKGCWQKRKKGLA